MNDKNKKHKEPLSEESLIEESDLLSKQKSNEACK
jgi:hypothetical protein